MARRATRQPKTLFPGQRRFRLRLAGLLEVKRLREQEEDDPEPTAVLPVESMRETVFGTDNEERTAA